MAQGDLERRVAWQHPYVSVLQLAGLGSNSGSTRGGSVGGAGGGVRSHAVGDVTEMMDKTIGKRCHRIAGAVSAANYLEVPKEARTAPLNLLGRYVYVQVRPIGAKVMTFHLDVLDAAGQPVRATFSTLYSATAESATAADCGGGENTKRKPASLAPKVLASNGGGGGGGSGGGGGAAALVRRGGAIRCPITFDSSRSRGWTVIAVDMVTLMLDEPAGQGGAAGGGGPGRGSGSGGGGGTGSKGYGVLRSIRLGSNMVVRGLYTSDKVYSPQTLPKDIALPVRGGGAWEDTYGWLWLPEVPDENAAPPPNGTQYHYSSGLPRRAWPPGAASPTPSSAAASAAAAHDRRRMEKRHFTAQSTLLGQLLKHDEGGDIADAEEGVHETTLNDDGLMEQAASLVARNGKAAGAPVAGEAKGNGKGNGWRMSLDGSSAALRPTTAAAAAATGRPLTRRLREERKSCGAYLGKGCSLAAAATPTTTTAAENGYDNHPIGGRTPSRQEMETPGRGDQTPPPATPPPMAGGGAEGRVGGGGAGGGARAGGKARERKRRESAPVYGVDSKQEQQQRRLVDVGGVASEEEHEEGEGDWTHAELEEWATQEPAPRTPAVAVLPAGGSGDLEEEEGGGEEVGGMGARLARECETEGGPDPPVVTRVLPPGLEPSRAEPPEFDPDPALRLERALCYTGDSLSDTLAFVGGDRLVAFPSNNVVVLMETPSTSEQQQQQPSTGLPSSGLPGNDKVTPCRSHVFLRGHTDRVTHLKMSTAGHILASAQGDALGGAGGRGIVRLWDMASFADGASSGGGGGRRAGGGGRARGEGGKCVAHFVAHRWGVKSICFSSDDRLLCTVGGDEHRRTQVIVWDVALLCTARAGALSGSGSGLAVVARQISDFPITKMLFSPFEKQRLVSCGRENVRFWRVRRRHLPACPAILNDFARDLQCTDLAFKSMCQDPALAGRRGSAVDASSSCVVYVSSSAGTLLQVSYHTRNLLCVLQLHDSPILSMTVNEGYAITGSADKLLRLWPLDFSDFLMEAAHESAVVSTNSSKDGLKLVVGTATGSIGVLNVMTHGYATGLRSHRGGVIAVAVDPYEARDEFATVGEDCTVRVWDLITGAQRYQFSSPEDQPTTVAYAPPPARVSFGQEMKVESGVGSHERHLVGGYTSGTMRVFDVPSTSTLYEFQQHRGPIQQVVFTPDGACVISAGADGLLCLYNVSRDYQPSRVMACDAPPPGRTISLAVSPGSDRLAVIGTEPSCILLYDLASMVLRRRLGRPPPPERRRTRGLSLAAGTAPGAGGGLDHSPPCGGVGGGIAGTTGDAGREFVHAAFSGNGADILACTATKFFRFPLGGGGGNSVGGGGGGSDVHAWSALLPCKAGTAVAACHPPSGPGLLLVSPSPAGLSFTATAAPGTMGMGSAIAGGGGAAAVKRGVATTSSLSPSEIFMCQVHRDEASASVVVSAPQVFAAHACPLTAATFSPSGKRLVTCDGAGVVLLWSNLAAPGEDAWSTTPARRAGHGLFDAAAASAAAAPAADDGGGGGGGVVNPYNFVDGDSDLLGLAVADDDDGDDDDNERQAAEDELLELLRLTAGFVDQDDREELREGRGEEGRVYVEDLDGAAEVRRVVPEIDTDPREGERGLYVRTDGGGGGAGGVAGRVGGGGGGDFRPLDTRPRREDMVMTELGRAEEEYAAMLDQTPPPQPTMSPAMFSRRWSECASETGAQAEEQVRQSDGGGPAFRAEALATLQTAMAQVAAAVSEDGELNAIAEAAGTDEDRDDNGDAPSLPGKLPIPLARCASPGFNTTRASAALARGFGYSSSSSSSNSNSSSSSSSSSSISSSTNSSNNSEYNEITGSDRGGDEEVRRATISTFETTEDATRKRASEDVGTINVAGGGGSGGSGRGGGDRRLANGATAATTSMAAMGHGADATTAAGMREERQVQAENIDLPPEEAGGGTVSCVRWHPASGTLVYKQGRELFAEDLASCYRRSLLLPMLPIAQAPPEEGEGVQREVDPVAGARRLPVAAGKRRGRDDDVVAVSPGGVCIARGLKRAGCGSVVTLSLGWGGSGSGRALRSSREEGGGDWRRVGTCDDKREMLALAFSPSGSELLSLATDGPDGTVALTVCSTIGEDSADSATTLVLPMKMAAGLNTSTIYTLVGRVAATAAAAAARSPPPSSLSSSSACRNAATTSNNNNGAQSRKGKPFLFVTGGENGVAVWLGLERLGATAATARVATGQPGHRRSWESSRGRKSNTGRCPTAVGVGGDGEGGGGGGGGGSGPARLEAGGGRMRLLGTVCNGAKGTVLASVGRFVVAAGVDVFGSDRQVTVIDVTRTWVEGEGYRGLDSIDVEATFPTFTWQAFGGGCATADNTAIITCVAAAGPRRVAVAGTGSRLEIWDIEMVEAAANAGHGAAKPGSGTSGACGVGGDSVVGLVQCLDLSGALDGAVITDMTWEAGGVDAVLGAGGGVWHLRLPPTYSDGSATISATTSVVDIEASLTPTVARIWPGGKVVNG